MKGNMENTLEGRDEKQLHVARSIPILTFTLQIANNTLQVCGFMVEMADAYKCCWTCYCVSITWITNSTKLFCYCFFNILLCLHWRIACFTNRRYVHQYRSSIRKFALGWGGGGKLKVLDFGGHQTVALRVRAFLKHFGMPSCHHQGSTSICGKRSYIWFREA